MIGLAELLELEHGVWRALVAGDADADGRALTDEFLGVYPTGFGSRTDHVDQLAHGPTVAEYELTDARIVPVAADAALVVYHASYRRPGRDDHEQMYVSSLWCRRDGRWLNTFSQDTPVGPPVV